MNNNKTPVLFKKKTGARFVQNQAASPYYSFSGYSPDRGGPCQGAAITPISFISTFAGVASGVVASSLI